MRAVVQRVASARVTVDGDLRGEIGPGLLIYTGAAEGNGGDEARWLAAKVAQLRIFDDDDGHFDRSLLDSGGAALVVSQFTLIADTRRGRRPSFTGAARPEAAEPLVERVMEELRSLGVPVEGGRFGAHMLVESVNDGPVTITLDSADRDRPRRG
ncbi:MAG: D-aminoacyl-tRNA deacylase [Dehalococcoidia bacterium]|jgi:D-tyrosyl-tRNA(Tyr) deacylase|nr:D-aminoacyl-tRNA deacylase [Dehalococcoidia bacterium]